MEVDIVMSARGLGKGLSALLGEDREGHVNRNGNIALLDVEALHPNSYQPRKYFPQESLDELCESIKSQGVLQPVLVRPGKNHGLYELIAGERRWRAAKLAGLREIPALVRDVSDRESLALALIENIQREDLNAIEQARALHQLQSECEATQHDLAERTGLSRSHIANLLRLLQLPDAMQRDILENAYTAGHGRTLMAITNADKQKLLRDKIIQDKLSVRSCEQYAAFWRENGFFPFEATPSPKKAIRNSNPLMEKYAERILKEINIKKVSFSGSEQRGTMTVSYGSEEEFNRLLAKLGVAPE
jgi:ParB family transcriptional regulator, chromosome partitioning protein